MKLKRFGSNSSPCRCYLYGAHRLLALSGLQGIIKPYAAPHPAGLKIYSVDVFYFRLWDMYRYLYWFEQTFFNENVSVAHVFGFYVVF